MPRVDLADSLSKVRSFLFLLLPDLKLAGHRNLKQLSATERTNRYENAKADAALAHQVDCALWDDTILQLMDYYEIVVYAQSGMIYLNGYIANKANQRQIESIIHSIPGVIKIQNNLVVDDMLVLEIAASLGKLERDYGCKFFITALQGVVSISGAVIDQAVKILAEQCATTNPDVRGVINNVRTSRYKLERAP